MGSSYLQNHLGFSLNEEQFEDIPHPMLELYTHVTMKTTQAGTFLGTAVIGPLTALARSSTGWKNVMANKEEIMKLSARFGRRGVLVGMAVGPLLTYAVTNGSTTEGYRDRCFRLRHNRDQVRVDRAVFTGGALGAGVNAFRQTSPFTGALVGVSAGIVLIAFYNNIIHRNKYT